MTAFSVDYASWVVDPASVGPFLAYERPDPFVVPFSDPAWRSPDLRGSLIVTVNGEARRVEGVMGPGLDRGCVFEPDLVLSVDTESELPGCWLPDGFSDLWAAGARLSVAGALSDDFLTFSAVPDPAADLGRPAGPCLETVGVPSGSVIGGAYPLYEYPAVFRCLRWAV
jgi:hypothetical protein